MQRDIYCHLKTRYFLLTYVPAAHSMWKPWKSSSAFQGAVKHHSDSSPTALSYQKIWLNNPQGFGIIQRELSEVQPSSSQPVNSSIHTRQGEMEAELQFLHRAHQAHASMFKIHHQTQGAGRNLLLSRHHVLGKPLHESPQTNILLSILLLEIRGDQHKKINPPTHSWMLLLNVNLGVCSNCTKSNPVLCGL